MSPVQHERELYLVKKKLSQAGPAPALSPVPSPAPAPLSIPRYLTVGTGKASYTEYEVRLYCSNQWGRSHLSTTVRARTKPCESP